MPDNDHYIIPAPQDAPRLHHEALHALYLIGHKLPEETTKDFLRELPHDTLAADLCAIIRWGIQCYGRINNSFGTGAGFPYEFEAVRHAYFIAGAVPGPEVLTCLLELLAAPEDLPDFYFGIEMLAEEGWWPICRCLPEGLSQCIAFMKRSDVSDFSLHIVLSALLYFRYSSDGAAEITLPELRSLARHYLHKAASGGEVDGFVAAELALRFIDDGVGDDAVLATELFKADLADEDVAGNLEQVLADKGKYPNQYARQKYNSIEELYAVLNSYHFGEDEPDFLDEPDHADWARSLLLNDPDEPGYDPQMPIVKGEKIGRNDPCPCGSGKKYKKCCLGKAA